MKTRLFITLTGITAIVLLTGACGSVPLIGKADDERRGRRPGTKAAYEMLCTSGDLVKVLEDTHFSKEMKEAFYQSNCSAERSYDKVKKLFISMTPEQRKDIRTAFKKNGYEINGGSC